MNRVQALSSLIGVLAVVTTAQAAEAALLRVPRAYPTIQDAVNAAAAGDTVLVSSGTYCGATLDRPVHLVARGRATIVGCDTGPALPNGARIGIFMPGEAGTSAASGSSVTGFTFDGRSVSNENLAPIAFGVFGRFVNGARVVNNRFLGTVQAVTNTAGDHWVIAHNSIRDLTLFDCTNLCTGGDGIVVQPARGRLAVAGGSAAPANRAEHNWIGFNRISGSVPDGFDLFSMAGVLVFAADHTAIVANSVALPDNPTAPAFGQGIVVSNSCCGEPAPLLPGSRHTFIALNDLRRSELGIVVDGEAGANTQGLVLRRNRGSAFIEEPPPVARALRFGASEAPSVKEITF